MMSAPAARPTAMAAGRLRPARDFAAGGRSVTTASGAVVAASTDSSSTAAPPMAVLARDVPVLGEQRAEVDGVRVPGLRPVVPGHRTGCGDARDVPGRPLARGLVAERLSAAPRRMRGAF